MATSAKQKLNALSRHRARLEKTTMREMFAADPKRFARFSASGCRILLDYSKKRIDEKAMGALFDLARATDVEGRRKAMWKGEHINVTEDRAVMHMALRYMGDKPVMVDGKDVMPDVRDVLGRMKVFSEQVRDGSIKGSSGETFT